MCNMPVERFLTRVVGEDNMHREQKSQMIKKHLIKIQFN